MSYLDWAPAGLQGLPSRMDLEGERLRIRLVVERWSVNGAPR
jgi:outer membrane biogenesis lipoprotein LolB